ncbi:MFS transporter [Reinekea thalattae]|uniref:MFS transporter n=1 Tax=Reinekea thalattae TaxID=2593301 RepID=UPI001C9BEB6E|nr:MFS transporter [Reinekea thalattae]
MKPLHHSQLITVSICLCSVVTFFNLYWVQPLLPLLQKDFGISSLGATLSISSALMGVGLGLLIFASWSDAIGRCKLLIIGTAGGLSITLIMPLIENYNVFIALRFIQGTLLAACPAVGVPLLGDELRKSWLAPAIGFYIAANSIGSVSSRLIAGLCASIGGSWQSAAMVVALLSMLLFAIVLYILPAQKRFKPTPFNLKDCLKSYQRHLRRPRLILLYVIISLMFGSFVNLFSFLMITLGAAPYELPSSILSLMFITFFGGTISASMAGNYAKKHGQISGVAIGIGIMLCANLFLLEGHLTAMVIGMIIMASGFFFGHAHASTLVGRSCKKHKGSAQALYSLFYYGGASAGAFVLDPFYQAWGWSGIVFGTSTAFIICLALIAIEYYYITDARDAKASAA